MKKLILTLCLVGSFSAFADVSPKCKELMDQRIEDEKITLDIIAKALETGEITEERAKQRLEDQDFLAEATAAVCSIHRLVKAQNSLRGQLGLTSLKRADRLAEQAAAAAMEYYRENRLR